VAGAGEVDNADICRSVAVASVLVPLSSGPTLLLRLTNLNSYFQQYLSLSSIDRAQNRFPRTMDSIYETQRQTHEEIDRYEQALADVLMQAPTAVSDRVTEGLFTSALEWGLVMLLTMA
jgi:hypothetical protein